MSGQYPITQTVSAVFPTGQPNAVTVKNTGTVNVYLGGDRSLSALSGYALGPGSAISWDAGKPLFAVCANGQTTVLSVLDNGGNLFDAAAVATQILDQGLAGSIAQQISISGAPPVDPLSIVQTDSFNVAGGAAYNSPWVNVSGFQSVIVRAAEVTSSSYTSPLPRRLTIWWSDVSGGIPYAQESFIISDTNNNAFGALVAFTTYETSVKNKWMQVQWASTTRGASLQSWITGSYKSKSRPDYVHQTAYGSVLPAGWSNTGNALDRLASAYTSAVAFTNNVGYWWYPSVSAGAGYRSIVFAQTAAIPAGGSMDAYIYALEDNSTTLLGKRAYTGPFPMEDDSPIIFPFAPIGVFLRYNNVTASTYAPAATVTLAYER